MRIRIRNLIISVCKRFHYLGLCTSPFWVELCGELRGRCHYVVQYVHVHVHHSHLPPPPPILSGTNERTAPSVHPLRVFYSDDFEFPTHLTHRTLFYSSFYVCFYSCSCFHFFSTPTQCVATGATLCYAISAAFGPALLTMPKWKARMDKWALKIEAQRANLLSFLIVIRYVLCCLLLLCPCGRGQSVQSSPVRAWPILPVPCP